jgi:hypothetical protein
VSSVVFALECRRRCWTTFTSAPGAIRPSRQPHRHRPRPGAGAPRPRSRLRRSARRRRRDRRRRRPSPWCAVHRSKASRSHGPPRSDIAHRATVQPQDAAITAAATYRQAHRHGQAEDVTRRGLHLCDPCEPLYIQWAQLEAAGGAIRSRTCGGNCRPATPQKPTTPPAGSPPPPPKPNSPSKHSLATSDAQAPPTSDLAVGGRICQSRARGEPPTRSEGSFWVVPHEP